MWLRRQSGFTLIEMMTVLAVIAVAAGAVAMAVSNSNPQIAAERGIANLSQAFANISEQAAILNHEIALKFDEESIVKYDLVQEQDDAGTITYSWVESGNMDISFFENEDLVLQFEAIDSFFNASADGITPDLVFFRTGEYQPDFYLKVLDADDELLLVGHGNGFNQVYATEEYDAF